MKAKHYQSLGNYIDLLLDMICVVDQQGHFVYVSASAESILGYPIRELIGRRMIDYVWSDDREKTLQQAERVMAGDAITNFENRYRHKEGKPVFLSWSARWSQSDGVRVAVARDISQVKQAQARQNAVYAISEAAHQSDDLAQLYQQIAAIVAALLPVQHFIIAMPDDETAQWQCRYQQLLTCAATAQVAPPDIKKFCVQVAQQLEVQQWPADCEEAGWLALPLQSGSGLQGVLLLHPGAGQDYSAEDIALLTFVTAQISAAIERRTMLARLEQLALHDSLTGLANRTLLHDRLQLALQRASREQRPLALLYLDLDRFKLVNDSVGHQAGDVLLQQTAQRILRAVRQTDTVARFGGDEFVILLEQIDQKSTVLKIAEKVRQALLPPFMLAGQQFCVYPSIGIALYPEHGQDSRQLLLRSDVAMYSAKHKGGNQIVLAGEPEQV
ncbi:sensor domain-containing diguanylate cyclase [Rheinheimera sp.]|uniref:sensor domain-containing diguanylate cyclase n=1 Tax=Rheinheimera sp. TaxID=1869214 RepID=UPI0027B987FF|nr:sensor domain-containing diguanylate cyclase [Rheinheimera sp.]